jgi:hypothetical protein
MTLLTLQDLDPILREWAPDPAAIDGWRDTAGPFWEAIIDDQLSRPGFDIFKAAAFGWCVGHTATTLTFIDNEEAIQDLTINLVNELIEAGEMLTPRTVAEHCFVQRARQHFEDVAAILAADVEASLEQLPPTGTA